MPVSPAGLHTAATDHLDPPDAPWAVEPMDALDSTMGLGDQAHGLRQLFAGHMLRFVPVASNPHMAFGGVVLERLCAAWAQRGLKTLVVDAGEQASEPCELAEFDLREGIEQLSQHVRFMAARGLPRRHVDLHGSSASFLDALAQAAPDVDVVLVHASASDIGRLFGRAARREGAQRLSPLVLVDPQASSITHAYGCIKLLAQRFGLPAHDLVACGKARAPVLAQIAQRLATCADSFLGAAQRGWVELDPAQPATQPPTAAFAQLAAQLLDVALPLAAAAPDSTLGSLPRAASALPSRPGPVLN
ncbi:MAG: flagellar biosynthesis protein [Burkholderiales bacterium]|nr:flagellar biosynthesis protein [Burkholderiales bacterium]